MTSTKSHLPIGRINTIMRSSSDVENVGKDSVLLMARAAEMFIRKLVVNSFQCMKEKDQNCKTLRYQYLAMVVQKSNRYHFLKDMIPMKITVREYKRLMAKKKGGTDEEAADEESSESESDGESSVSSRSSRSVVSVSSS